MALLVRNHQLKSTKTDSHDWQARPEPTGSATAAAFSDIVGLAKRIFDVDAFVSVLDSNRKVFRSSNGADVYETDSEIAFSSHTMLSQDAFIILDAASNPKFSDYPFVKGHPYVRFYVGVPLFASSGQAIGTLCLAGTQARDTFSDEDLHTLRQLAQLTRDRMDRGRVEIVQRESQRRFEHIASTSPDGIVCSDADGCITFWNAAAERMFGYSVTEAIGQSIDLIVPERMRGGHTNGLHRVANGGEPRLVGKTIELPAQHKNGDEFPIELSLSQWQEQGRAAFGSIVRDIRERRTNEERLFRLAHLDPLTGLPNRAVLRERLIAIVSAARPVTVLMLDLDGFKEINDSHGHAVGDAFLKITADRVLSCARPTDTVSRLGGDEFVLLLLDVGDPIEAAEIANAVTSAVALPFDYDGQMLKLHCSIGIAVAPEHGESAEDLLSCADLALYKAKNDGRNCYRFFTQNLRDRIRRVRACRDEIALAIDRGEFVLHYQPQIRLSDGVLAGAEALIRWQHPRRGLLQPASFLDVLDSSAYAAEVGDWVLKTACSQAATWRQAGAAEFRIGVNLCSAQFQRGDLVERVRDILHSTGLPAKNLELEITENIMLRQEFDMIEPLQQLRDDGVGVAFDDYGTGYASLSLLKRFPLTRLKIDRSFVSGMLGSRKDQTIVRAILQLGHGFGLAVIAEGIETADELSRLRAKGCQEGQGYHIGKPMPADAFTDRYSAII